MDEKKQKEKIEQFIITDPEIMGGKPVIKGTRIPVSRVLQLLKDGYTIEAIHDEYPHVNIGTLSGTVSEIVHIFDNKDYASKIL